MKPPDPENKNQHWRIHISEWGTLWAIGTEQEAEEWIRHKCRWEHLTGNKRLATEEEIKDEKFEPLDKFIE